MILRVCPTSGEVRLTMPKRASATSARRFLDQHVDWICDERGKAHAIVPVSDGSMLDVEGYSRRVQFTGIAPRGVRLVDDAIVVGGPKDHAARRLNNWLRAEAKTRMIAASATYAEILGARYVRVSIGDMRSRWGSCSSRGTLRFNWRLLMAPPDVLHYVAAHEVAHLLEMNHSDRFWAHVERCIPDFEVHRRWLKKHGAALFAVKI